MPLRIAFVMDPLESVLIHHDSTFALMLEAQRRGHVVGWCEAAWLSVRDGVADARWRTVRVRRDAGRHFDLLSERREPVAAWDAVLLRTDPPVGPDYLHMTQLVELGPGRPFFVNEPAALRSVNEKLFALSFPELTPRTLVSADAPELLAFVDAQPLGAVLKPLDGFGGAGVVHVGRRDRNARSLVALLSGDGRRPIVAQEFLPASREGDKRILLVDGEPAGAVLRVPREDDLRANLAVGAAATGAAVTDDDRALCARLRPVLRERGLWFVGADVIGGRLTELNVTSPTGVVEAEALSGARVAAAVLELIEARATRRADPAGGAAR